MQRLLGSKAAHLFLAFVGIGFLVFGATLNSSYVSWDDKYLIVENPVVHEFNAENIKTAFTTYDPELYVPLTLLTYQIEHSVFGGSSTVLHAHNLILHILNGFLLWVILSMFFTRKWLSLLLALMFLVHPLNTEAVAWASARKDVLSTLFFLLSTLFYLRWIDNVRARTLWLSVGLFLLGLLSKVMVLTLPVALLLFDALRGRTMNMQRGIEKWPYWILSIVFGIVAMFGKTTVLESSTYFQKLLMAGKSTVFYLQKFIWPTELSIVYPFTGIIRASDPFFLIPAIITALLVLLSVWLFHKRRSAAIGLLFFFITLVPTFINFSKGGDFYFASDRYAYIPMMGLLIAVGSLLSWWIDSRSARFSEKAEIFSKLTLLLLLFVFGFWTTKQVATWKNGASLYAHALEYYPNSRAIQNNLGMEYLASLETHTALQYFDRSLEIREDPKVRANRAAALLQLGRLEEAKEEFIHSLVDDPENTDAHYGLGNIARKEGKLDQAILHYAAALKIDPLYGNALNNLGAVYLQLGDWDNAITVLEVLIATKEDFPEALYNLGGAYSQIGDLPKAEAALVQAYELHPENFDAAALLATVLYRQGQIDPAAKLLQTVFLNDPENPQGHALWEEMRRDGVAE